MKIHEVPIGSLSSVQDILSRKRGTAVNGSSANRRIEKTGTQSTSIKEEKTQDKDKEKKKKRKREDGKK
jgi:hypothetical protein